MFVLVVTGGIGAGKSEAARHFAERGAVVLDADLLAKALVIAPGPVRDAVAEAFPVAIAADGSIDTGTLAGEAFATAEATRRLDRIVHPAVTRELANGLRDLQLLERPPRVVVVDVPLLAEAPAIAELADAVLAIEAPADERVRRCVERGMAEADARARLARQAPDVARRELADTVVANDGSREEFLSALDRFWEREVAPNAA